MPHLFFIPGADERALLAALDGDGDVLVQELEDFTPPARRPEARALAVDILQRWRACGRVSAVRINPFETCGHEDLAAVMAGRPQVVMMSKVERREQMIELDQLITELEGRHGIAAGSTLIVPNIETALGVVRAIEIAAASPRIKAMLVATEDMVADLGAGRSRAGTELYYPRSRFLLECAAAGCWPSTRPTPLPTRRVPKPTCSSPAPSATRPGCGQPGARGGRQSLPHPADADAELARRQVAAFEAAAQGGNVRAEVDGLVVEVPSYLQALRLLERYEQLQARQALRR